MPYYISDEQSDCSGWATVKEESDGTYTTIGCHDSKQDAIDQMIAISISESILHSFINSKMLFYFPTSGPTYVLK